jgi:E3 ubiquitin-protein ligase HERC2
MYCIFLANCFFISHLLCYSGKLGHNSEENVTAPCIIPTLDNVEVVQISAGCEHSGAITAAGELFTWGHGDGGRLGHGDSEARIVPTKVEALLQMHARCVN